MKKLFLLFVLAGVILFGGVAEATDPNAYPLVEGESYEWAVVDAHYRYDEAYKMMDLVNAYRAENGLHTLETNDALMKIAMQRALECNVRFNHTASYSDTGYYPSFRMMGFDDKIYRAVEVITGTYSYSSNAEHALDNFKNSEGHNGNILDQHATGKVAIGVGFVNQCCVVCFFTDMHVMEQGELCTDLQDYYSVEVVPFLTSVKSEAYFNYGKTALYSTKDAAIAATNGDYKEVAKICPCASCKATKHAGTCICIDCVPNHAQYCTCKVCIKNHKSDCTCETCLAKHPADCQCSVHKKVEEPTTEAPVEEKPVEQPTTEAPVEEPTTGEHPVGCECYDCLDKHEKYCDCDPCLGREASIIKPVKVSKLSVSKKRTGSKTKLTVKFSKVKAFSGANYQIKVYKDKKCKKVLKTKNTSKNKWTVTISNKKYKKVYVKVRCYKDLDGKKVYGKWSSVKTIKTK